MSVSVLVLCVKVCDDHAEVLAHLFLGRVVAGRYFPDSERGKGDKRPEYVAVCGKEWRGEGAVVLVERGDQLICAKDRIEGG
jgi:hypothetical protein